MMECISSPTYSPLPPFFSAVALGASVGRRQDKLLRMGRALVSMHGQVGEVLRCSSFFITPPWGGRAQHDFVNGACLLRSSLNAAKQLELLHKIEDEQGRERDDERWQDRTLDLDLLWVQDQRGKSVVVSGPLTLPHSELCSRDFMWWPFRELWDQQFFWPDPSSELGMQQEHEFRQRMKVEGQDGGRWYLEKVSPSELCDIWHATFAPEGREGQMLRNLLSFS